MPISRQAAETEPQGASHDPRTSRANNVALEAADAGIYMARILGRAVPYSAQQMWAMARQGQVPVVRIGRRVYFQTHALDAFIAAGGSKGGRLNS